MEKGRLEFSLHFDPTSYCDDFVTHKVFIIKNSQHFTIQLITALNIATELFILIFKVPTKILKAGQYQIDLQGRFGLNLNQIMTYLDWNKVFRKLS